MFLNLLINILSQFNEYFCRNIIKLFDRMVMLLLFNETDQNMMRKKTKIITLKTENIRRAALS